MASGSSFVTISNENNDLITLAVEVWRLEKKINKIKLPKDNAQSINNTIGKIKAFLAKHKIEITDFTDMIFNDGLNVDVLATSDEKKDKPIISETIEPMVKYNGEIKKRAKVIVTK